MNASNAAKEAYRAYKELHRRFESGDVDVTEGAVEATFQRYLDVHQEHDAPHGYHHYEPYYLSTARRS